MSAQLSTSETRHTAPILQEKVEFDCDICSKEFSKRAYLNIHRKNVHKAPGVYSKLGQNKTEARMERPNYKRGVCEKEYCWKNSLTRYIKEKHGNEQINLGSLRSHSEEKHGKEPIRSGQPTKTAFIRTNVFGGNSEKCELCDEQFVTRGAVFKHMNTHHIDVLEVAGILARMAEYKKYAVPKEAEDNKENNSVQIPLPAPIVASASTTTPTSIIVPAPAPPVIQKVIGSQEFMIANIIRKTPFFSV
ncbi:hypothetical protein B9Z55_028724 [Caenorhabditis nigoni]|uniref:C2H2-type domain-containing protein n=1 Tax=Caenorhabditis nigoni TaxID=1611254 RepID=A0A2G5SAS1_9PELO|nr:hypothetical protein B9Z55_028724 [Caenorhabditis nigoni]